MRYIFLLSLILITLSLSGQTGKISFTANEKKELSAFEDTLSFYAFSIVNDSLPEDRFYATRELIVTLVKTLKIKNSFYYPFSKLKSVSLQYPPDSSFRMFTWQLAVSPTEFRYYGALQRKSDSLILFPLIDRSFTISQPDVASLSPENWMGCLVYGIQQFGVGDSATYLAFGYDANDGKTRKKWIEPIRFVGNKPVFGAPIFPPNPKDSSATIPLRFILSYSAESTIKLNYDSELGLIVFDHLAPLVLKAGQPEEMVPDGSYEAFKILPNKLEYIEMLTVTSTDEEAIRQKPILGREGKDLFGKSILEKKKKGNN
jgi:hypothetical protein